MSHGRLILVVDDNEMVRELVALILTSDGYAVTQAASGAEALEVLRGNEVVVDLLLTDVRMPRMTGPELVAAARADQPLLPALFMTAYPTADVEPCVAKPFTAEQLLAQVAAMLPST